MRRLLWLTLLLTACGAETPPRRLLIHKSILLQGNQALLVEDPREVRRMYALLRGNGTTGHVCLWHWQLTFELENGRFWSFPFNQDCERFSRDNDELQKRIRAYTRRIDERPAHYLLDVAIPPTADVEPVRRRLRDAGYRVLLLSPDAARYPTVRLEASAKGTRRGDEEIPPEMKERAHALLREGIALLRRRGHLRHAGPIMQSFASYQKERIAYAAKSHAVLARTFRPEDVASYPESLSFCEYFEPSEYVINVVAGEPLSPALEKRLRQLVPNALRVAATPTSRRHDTNAYRDLRCPLE